MRDLGWFGLSERMRSRGATNISLAQAAGVAHGTIAQARAGRPVRVFNAECIEQALFEREFTRDNRGAR